VSTYSSNFESVPWCLLRVAGSGKDKTAVGNAGKKDSHTASNHHSLGGRKTKGNLRPLHIIREREMSPEAVSGMGELMRERRVTRE